MPAHCIDYVDASVYLFAIRQILVRCAVHRTLANSFKTTVKLMFKHIETHYVKHTVHFRFQVFDVILHQFCSCIVLLF